MSNSLIPYSFTPGTKAKAQEVNANFIALATQIEENKEYVTEKIQETVESVNSDKADKNLANTNLLTNCILEAPNGVVEYSGNSITIKEGLKVLIPDGRSTDGSVKSIEYTVEEDFQITTAKNDTVNCVYVTTGTHGIAEVFQFSPEAPVLAKGLWFNPLENKTYIYNTSSSQWTETPSVIIATYKNTDETVSNLITVNPVSLLKENDVPDICSWSNLDYSKMVQKAMNTDYIATTDGCVYANAETQEGYSAFLTINSQQFLVNRYDRGCQSSFSMPVSKGDKYRHSNGSSLDRLYFIPCKGGI